MLPGVRRRRRDHHIFSLVSQTDPGEELNSGNESAWSVNNKRGYDILIVGGRHGSLSVEKVVEYAPQ